MGCSRPESAVNVKQCGHQLGVRSGRYAMRKVPNLFWIMFWNLMKKFQKEMCTNPTIYSLRGRFNEPWSSFTDSFRIHTLQVKDLWTEFWLYANFPSGVWCVSENSVQEGFSVFPRTKQWQKQLISDKCTFLCKASSLPISPLLPASNAQPVNF